jgi:hypothetical protein
MGLGGSSGPFRCGRMELATDAIRSSFSLGRKRGYDESS